MLPLLPSIPKKKITIDNIEYEVYLPIGYSYNHLVARINGKIVRKFVNPYEQILYEPSRIRAKARALEEAFDKINRVIEKEYQGDDLKLACEKPLACVYTHPKGMVFVDMKYFCKKTKKSVLHRAYVGMAKNLTKAALEKTRSEVAQLRATLNKEYNEHLQQMRQEFRKLVEMELSARAI